MEDKAGRCKKCGGNDLILEKGYYICRDCGNNGNYDEWVKNNDKSNNV